MLNINQIALFALTAGSAVAAPFRLQQRQAAGLNTAAVAAGKLYFGSATDNPELTDTAYTTGLSNTADFGQITPGNSMKWDTIEPSRNTFSYTKGDAIADLAAKNGQKLRCHTLVWYNQLPSWVKNGKFDNATLITILENHITNEVTHYKGKCYAWDVVNEAISDNGDGSYRSNVFYDTIGEAYIPIAFAAAAAADPDAKLYYNDYSIESAGAKSTRAQTIVKLIQSYGARIDGVGLQSHFIVGSTPSTTAQVANMKAFTDLGVDVAITELDIRTSSPDNTAYETQQATDYANTIKACAQTKRCVGVTIWDYTDKYSWVPSTFSGQGAALPWDENLSKKPAYDAILNAWGPAVASPSSSSALVASPSTSSIAKPATTTSSPAAATTDYSPPIYGTSTLPYSAASSSSAFTSATPSATSNTTSAPSLLPSASANSTATATFACNPAHAYPNGASCISTAGSLTLVTPTASISASASAAPAEHGGTTAAATLSASATASAAPEATSASVAPTSSNVVSPVPTDGAGDDDDGECEVEYIYV